MPTMTTTHNLFSFKRSASWHECSPHSCHSQLLISLRNNIRTIIALFFLEGTPDYFLNGAFLVKATPASPHTVIVGMPLLPDLGLLRHAAVELSDPPLHSSNTVLDQALCPFFSTVFALFMISNVFCTQTHIAPPSSSQRPRLTTPICITLRAHDAHQGSPTIVGRLRCTFALEAPVKATPVLMVCSSTFSSLTSAASSKHCTPVLCSFT